MIEDLEFFIIGRRAIFRFSAISKLKARRWRRTWRDMRSGNLIKRLFGISVRREMRS